MFLFQASASGLLFYTKARRNLWRQALAMSGVAIAAFGFILAKRLTIQYGRGIPIILWNFQVLCNIMGASDLVGLFHRCSALVVSTTPFALSVESPGRYPARSRPTCKAATSPNVHHALRRIHKRRRLAATWPAGSSPTSQSLTNHWRHREGGWGGRPAPIRGTQALHGDLRSLRSARPQLNSSCSRSSAHKGCKNSNKRFRQPATGAVAGSQTGGCLRRQGRISRRNGG